MVTETAAGVRGDVLEAILSELSGSVLATCSTLEDLVGLVSVLESEPFEEPLRVLVDERTGKVIGKRFLLASRVADLREGGVLEVHVAEPRAPYSTLFLGAERVRSVASLPEGTAVAMEANVEVGFLETAREDYLAEWESAESLSSRTPAYSTILETLEEALDEAMRSDVETVFRAVGVGIEGTDVRPVPLLLSMGAKNEVQFYELSLWGESEHIASRAKFSREKQALEAAGFLDTERVPTDVGRPRQRLVLAADVDGSDPVELYDTVRDGLGE